MAYDLQYKKYKPTRNIMKPITVNELYNELGKIIANGNGNRSILMTSDDEGNSYHYMWFYPEECNEESYDISFGLPWGLSMDEVRKNCVILG